jgi:iron(II)-dependent oxidoreductase
MTTSALSLNNESCLRRIAEARCVTDRLFAVVCENSLYERPIPERHRIIFYIGHLEAFDWNLLNRRAAPRASKAPNASGDPAQLDKLFAFGIDPVDGGLPTDRQEDWPSLERVRQYVADRRRAIDETIRTGSFDHPEPQRHPDPLLHVAVEHRLMHAETLAYMFHQLPYSAKHIPTQAVESSLARTAGYIQPGHMVHIPAGITTLGLDSSEGVFGWDNEFQANDVFVPGFQIDKYMVTNGQFLEFLQAGGYTDSKLWRPEDWLWREENRIEHPVFWTKRGDEWFYRGMFAEIPLPLDWPVYVSQAEAAAFAKWSKKLLPTEVQWHRAAYGTGTSHQRAYPWGEESPASARGNFDFRRWDPSPVTEDELTSQSSFGVAGMLGNGWEWTSTPFAPFPGFQPFVFYPGYSANFFDGKHFVMKGASPRTAAPFLRRSFRNWFQPHYQYMYAGFRCVSKSKD